MNEPVTQAQDHDRRIGKLEGTVEQGITPRLERIEHAVSEIRQEIADLRRDTNARFDSQTRWLVGMQVASLLAIGSLLVSILLKLP